MMKLPLIDIGGTIKHCLEVINSGAAGIALVVDSQGQLVGVMTDGDIRRGLLGGITIDRPIASLVRSNFHSVLAGQSQRDQALSIMKRYGISAVPVVNEDQQPVSIELINRKFGDVEIRNELVVIMAGGRGVRLLPLTRDVPKPMLNVRGKPILQHILEQLVDQGFRRFVITLNYLGSAIKDHFQDGQAWGVEIRYTEETEPLGTAGAIGLIAPSPDDNFVVMNGDVISPFDPREMIDHHRKTSATATMAVSLQRTDLAYGVVEAEDGVIQTIKEKPSYHHLVNAGVYVLSPEALGSVPSGKAYNMTDLFRDLISSGAKTRAFALYEDWIDIGQHEHFEKANDA